MTILRNDFKNTINDLEKGIQVAEKSFIGLTFYSNEANDKLKEAKVLLQNSKVKVNNIQNFNLKHIDESIEIGSIDNVKRQVDSGKKSAFTAGENLVEISKLIEEAKQLEKPKEKKFCFLWWCW